MYVAKYILYQYVERECRNSQFLELHWLTKLLALSPAFVPLEDRQPFIAFYFFFSKFMILKLTEESLFN